MLLTEKIHLLRIDFEIPLSPERKLSRFVNSIIIFGEKITIIDTGVKGSEEKIFTYIEQNQRSISDIGTIILSHSHPDHIGAANKIKEVTRCTVLAHKGEAEWIEHIEIQNRERPVPGFFSLVDHSTKIDHLLVGGEKLKAANDVTLQILHSPGHSKGSLNILFLEDMVLFTADSIPLKDDVPNYDNYHDLVRSIQTIREDNRYTTLLTSWTPPLRSSIEWERILSEGEAYLRLIDNTVKQSYNGNEMEPLASCRKVIGKLGLPPFLAMPITDKAFRSHLGNHVENQSF